jgi:hypothetical protein
MVTWQSFDLAADNVLVACIRLRHAVNPIYVCPVAFHHCMPLARLRVHRRTATQRFFSDVSYDPPKQGNVAVHVICSSTTFKILVDVWLFYDSVSSDMFRLIRRHRVITNKEYEMKLPWLVWRHCPIDGAFKDLGKPREYSVTSRDSNKFFTIGS